MGSARRRMSSSRRASARARLDEALERTGSDALAYARVGNADVVRDQLLDLIAAFPSLVVDEQVYYHTDGARERLLCAKGTVPIEYGGGRYNIPVDKSSTPPSRTRSTFSMNYSTTAGSNSTITF